MEKYVVSKEKGKILDQNVWYVRNPEGRLVAVCGTRKEALKVARLFSKGE